MGLQRVRHNWATFIFTYNLGLPGESVVKKPTQETSIQPLGQEDLLEKEMATHSSFLNLKTPWAEEPCELQSMRLQKSQTQLSD